MTDFEAQVLGDLQVLKAQMEQVMGIGQPGRLHEHDHRLASLERAMQRMRGALAAFGITLTLVHLAITYFSNHHG